MILVTGATGQLGRLVVAELQQRLPPGESLAVSVRDPAKAAALTAQGVDVRRGDFDDRASLRQAFKGATRALIISADGPNEHRIRQHRAAIDAAKDAGVRHVVYTSCADTDPRSPFAFAAIHHDTEAYLARSGLAYTVLRNGYYADMIQIFAGQAKATGTLAVPAGTGAVSFISRADLARTAAEVLLSDRYANQTLLLTGEQAIGFAQIAEILARQLGRPVAYVNCAPADYTKALLGAGLPPFLAEAITGIHRATAEGRNAETSDAVRRITGTPPETLPHFLERVFPRAAA